MRTLTTSYYNSTVILLKLLYGLLNTLLGRGEGIVFTELSARFGKGNISPCKQVSLGQHLFVQMLALFKILILSICGIKYGKVIIWHNTSNVFVHRCTVLGLLVGGGVERHHILIQLIISIYCTSSAVI